MADTGEMEVECIEIAIIPPFFAGRRGLIKGRISKHDNLWQNTMSKRIYLCTLHTVATNGLQINGH